MTECAVSTEEKLLSDFVLNRRNKSTRVKILQKIAERGKIFESDFLLIRGITEKLDAMEDADFDLIEETETYKRLSRECLNLQRQLLQRMNGEP
ncbi:MAG: hypothetical protein A2402_02330 [Candidatus Staskawiczbacteria bacterium RIFOXYC1_FULL_37_43]|nr:MAG: hypothetical protein A2813_01940 [Candidatus Staskawiczbacteria bacterium RIFCSPHIGHO2_01_FULL_37_17]OGZ71218.1 MAG: hypothetical protein A2891_03065 [Candidatus Staskawiczbacteria bacterium RIFCSPLOWO2_01_FULL_37_19]OGZ75642.1 MAG: hypothetical protein A2205_00410 [Candidatus Staskawiczbacteria bacterium RIFOXYA1_FULL_37_15]OGZ76666.1 MAG: hypothetical protein A2280_00500 [Candidatus Staskawiczbacteria bacterium RIFOXYA12_FULL_37_10]OGZ79918.1 MAG: hypothetical protein A2353_01650 [Can